MDVRRGWLWAAFVAVIALVLLRALVVDPAFRAALSTVAITPSRILAVRVARGVQQREPYKKIRFSKLRSVTDEFFRVARNSNRITRDV